MGNAFTELFMNIQDVLSGIVNRVVIAAVILLIGFIIGKLAGKLLSKALHEVDLDNALRSAGIRLSIADIASAFVTYLIYFVSIVMALDKLGLNTFVFNVLAIGMIAVIILSILLAIKDLIPNMLAGLFIHQRNFIKVGDRLRLKDVEGKVVYMNLFETRLKTKKGDMIVVPNSALVKEKVVKLKKP